MCKSNLSFVIFGSTGWFGQATLDFLLKLNKRSENKFRIVAVAREEKMLPIGEAGFMTTPLTHLDTLEIKNPIVFHFAYLTREKIKDMPLSAYIMENLAISTTVAKFLDKWQPLGLVYTSSGAVYDSFPLRDKGDIGKNPYGMLKLYDEAFFEKLSKEIGFKLVIPRVFNVSGPYMTKRNGYGLGSLIDQSKLGKRISIQAKNPIYRSFISIESIIDLSLKYISDPSSLGSILFDACGPEVVEIGELAARIKDVLKSEAKIEREFDPKLESNFYQGNPDKFLQLTKKYNVLISSLESQILSSQ